MEEFIDAIEIRMKVLRKARHEDQFAVHNRAGGHAGGRPRSEATDHCGVAADNKTAVVGVEEIAAQNVALLRVA